MAAIKITSDRRHDERCGKIEDESTCNQTPGCYEWDRCKTSHKSGVVWAVGAALFYIAILCFSYPYYLCMCNLLIAFDAFGSPVCRHLEHERDGLNEKTMTALIWCSAILMSCPTSWRKPLFDAVAHCWLAGEQTNTPFTDPLVTYKSTFAQAQIRAKLLVEWIEIDNKRKKAERDIRRKNNMTRSDIARLKRIASKERARYPPDFAEGWRIHRTDMSVLVERRDTLQRQVDDHPGRIVQEAIPETFLRHLSQEALELLEIDLPDLHGETVPPAIMKLWKKQQRILRSPKNCKQCTEMFF